MRDREEQGYDARNLKYLHRIDRVMKRILVALIVLASLGCDGMDRAESVRKMNEGLDAYQRGQNIEAVDALKEASILDPTYAEPAYYVGQIYHITLKELDNAERYYRDAKDRDKENPQITYRLGTVLAEKGKWSEAEGVLAEATRLDGKFAKAWFRTGVVQEHQEKYRSAVESYMKAINANARMQMDKKDPGGAAYHALGDLYIRFKQYDKALAVYENGILNNDIKSRPSRPVQLFSGKGVALLHLKKYSESARAFEMALSIDTSHTTSIFNLAVANMAMKQTQKAVKGFEQFKSRADRSKDEARIAAAQGFIQQMKSAAAKNENK